MNAWDPDSEWAREAYKMGIYPDLAKQCGPINHDHVEKDVFATVHSPQSAREFDEPEETGTELSLNAADAVLRVLYILCGAEHPSLRLRADCLLAIINRTENRSQSEIGRKYNLTRSAISKIMRTMRKGDYLAGLEIFFFGGRKVASERARIRAIRIHKESKVKAESWKSSQTLTNLLAHL